VAESTRAETELSRGVVRDMRGTWRQGLQVALVALGVPVTRLYLHRLVHILQRRFGDLAGLVASLCHDVVQV
jgi:hypothetical protein